MKLKMLFYVIFLIGCGEDIKEEVIETYIDDSPKLIHTTLGEGEEKIIKEKLLLKQNGDTIKLTIGDTLIKKYDYYTNDTLKLVSVFLNNQKSGQWRYFHENGKVDCIMHYHNDMIDSSYKEFYENGKKAIVGFYKSGIREDKWQFFDVQGNLIGDCKYLKGDLYYSDGTCYMTNYAD